MIFNKLIPELSATNLDKSLDFYKKCGISFEGSQIMIQEISEKDKWVLENLTYPFGNGVNFQIEVKNVDRIYNKLKESNYPIAFDMEEKWYRENNKLLGNKEFLVQDPDGYLLRFCEDLGEKYER